MVGGRQILFVYSEMIQQIISSPVVLAEPHSATSPLRIYKNWDAIISTSYNSAIRVFEHQLGIINADFAPQPKSVSCHLVVSVHHHQAISVPVTGHKSYLSAHVLSQSSRIVKRWKQRCILAPTVASFAPARLIPDLSSKLTLSHQSWPKILSPWGRSGL